jgi:hypothetical protein
MSSVVTYIIPKNRVIVSDPSDSTSVRALRRTWPGFVRSARASETQVEPFLSSSEAPPGRLSTATILAFLDTATGCAELLGGFDLRVGRFLFRPGFNARWLFLASFSLQCG